MPFTDRLKVVVKDPKETSPYFRKTTNNEGGPAGPLNIEKARDWEITWEKGRAILLNTPRAPRPQGEDMPETPKFRPDLTWDRGGANNGTLPDNPNGPLDRLNYSNKDRKITEENMSISYVNRLAAVLSMTAPLVFKDVLKIVKQFFPELKMKFPKPPTYVWNPKKQEDASKGKDEKEDTEEEVETDDESAKLDPQEIKDKLKVKIPQLKWTLRMMDGVEEAELEFADESLALFEIGAKANHLTVTYTEPPKDASNIKYDDSESDDEDEEAPTA